MNPALDMRDHGPGPVDTAKRGRILKANANRGNRACQPTGENSGSYGHARLLIQLSWRHRRDFCSCRLTRAARGKAHKGARASGAENMDRYVEPRCNTTEAGRASWCATRTGPTAGASPESVTNHFWPLKCGAGKATKADAKAAPTQYEPRPKSPTTTDGRRRTTG